MTESSLISVVILITLGKLHVLLSDLVNAVRENGVVNRKLLLSAHKYGLILFVLY